MSVKFLDHVELDGVSRVRFIGDPVDPQDAATRSWVLTEISEGITEAGALDIEGVQDVVGAMLSGTGITAAYDDAAGTILLTVTDSPTLAGFTPADLRARSSHTGTQSLDTTTDSATRLALSPAERTKLGGVEDGATANAEDEFLLARANHTGTQSLDTTTDTATRVAFTPAERTKLDGVAAGATANATDADLRARASHTGTQSADTIVDGTTNHVFTALDDDKLAGIAAGATANATDGFLVNRANHTGTQSLDTTTDSATRLALTPAERDKLADVAEGATANSTDEALRDRATHTGTQSADTLTNGTTNKVYTAGEQTKLAGVEAGATANEDDDFLLARENHTGTQALATITGHDKAAHDALAINAATVGGLTAGDIQANVTAAIVDGAPGALDTLNEIATRLGENAGSITDIFDALALRNQTAAATIGDGTANVFTVTHGLGTEDITVQIWETGGNRNKVDTTVSISSTNAVVVSFGVAPAAGAYRVVVQGA